MVRIRLRRVGLKKQPSYRVIITDQRSARDGRFIEIIGYHNPRTEPPTDDIDEARVLYWLSVGAQPSEALKNILNRTGTLARFERMKQGESLESLVAEAEAHKAANPVSPRTHYPSPAPGQSKKKAREAAALLAKQNQ